MSLSLNYVHTHMHNIGTYRGYGDLRLAQGNVTSFTFTAGRLEIYFPDEWGTICDNFFGHLEADVACRQLGYSEARQYGNNLGYVNLLWMQGIIIIIRYGFLSKVWFRIKSSADMVGSCQLQ